MGCEEVLPVEVIGRETGCVVAAAAAAAAAVVVVVAAVFLVVWTVVLVRVLVFYIAFVDVAAVEAELEMLRTHMAFPLVFGGKHAVAAVLCEAALELSSASGGLGRRGRRRQHGRSRTLSSLVAARLRLAL